MKTAAVAVGLCLTLPAARKGDKAAALLLFGFGLMLLSGLISTLTAAWMLAHRTDLKELLFDHPTRRRIWEWYHWIDVNQCIAGAGMILVIAAVYRLFRTESEAREASG